MRWLALLLFVGCVEPTQKARDALWAGHGVDQCVYREVFADCLKAVPPGPPTTTFNDWAEVVEECGRQASYISERQRTAIRPECLGAR